jgi:hypothetical protein
MISNLQESDYVTFTGHGSRHWLALEADTKLMADEIPPLPAVVVATAACNTFRPWEENSIALAFADQGAAAYAGFVYSPNAGYLIGAYEHLPMRYTWPEYPIGHVVQVQNQGALQGFASFPYYYLLGDPRIALQADTPYTIIADEATGTNRTLTLTGAPSGMVPVIIPDGAPYRFVDVPGVTAAWARGPFYNARLQMADIGPDKFLLVTHKEGDLTLKLRTQPPVLWLTGDLLRDSLDAVFLFTTQHDGDITFLVGGLVLWALGGLLLRKRATRQVLLLAMLVGLGFTALHAIYGLARSGQVTITSKYIYFDPLSLPGTFLVTSCGAFIFLTARRCLGRLVGLLVAASQPLFVALAGTLLLTIANRFFMAPELGASLWNLNIGWQAVPALILLLVLFGILIGMLGRVHDSIAKESVQV